jgi:phosphohistidine phosphatase SixA
MKSFRLFAIALAIAVQIAAAAPAVVLIVRHAEKEALPADDPALTPAGRERAAELVRVVRAWSAGGTPVRALVSSEVKRTHETLEPLAASTGLAITVVGAKDTAAIVKTILAVDGGIVVLAGHSNTLPAIVQALGGPNGIAIADAEYDQLFALTAPGANAALVTLRYGR